MNDLQILKNEYISNRQKNIVEFLNTFYKKHFLEISYYLIYLKEITVVHTINYLVLFFE